MFENGTEVIAQVGHVFFRGFVQASFIWKGSRYCVVTNHDHLFVALESKCKNARPVFVEE
jgi:hypothetical protein